MNIIVKDNIGRKNIINWPAGQFNNLTFRSERIGGMQEANFNVPDEYAAYYEWAKYQNQVEIYHSSELVFAGYINNISRFWSETGSGLSVQVYGYVAKFAKDYSTTNLSAEKASTYIVDHILEGMVADYIVAGTIDTSDYTIPGTLIYDDPHKTKRYILDDIYSYNRNTHEWGVWGKKFYWRLASTNVRYVAVLDKAVGEVSQGGGNFGNNVRAAYRDEDGNWQGVLVTDSDSKYNTEYYLETYEDNMTAAQATQRAEQTLARVKRLGTNAPIKLKHVLDKQRGEIHASEIQPGFVLELPGLIPGEASIAETYIANDLDTFPIEAVSYDDESETAEISPGGLSYNMDTVVGGF